MIFSPEDIFLLSSSIFVLQQCISLKQALKNKAVLKSHKKLLGLSMTGAVLQFLYIVFTIFMENRSNRNVTKCIWKDGTLKHGAPVFGWILGNLFILSVVEDLNRRYPTGRKKAAKSLSVMFMTLLCLLAVVNAYAAIVLQVPYQCGGVSYSNL